MGFTNLKKNKVEYHSVVSQNEITWVFKILSINLYS